MHDGNAREHRWHRRVPNAKSCAARWHLTLALGAVAMAIGACAQNPAAGHSSTTHLGIVKVVRPTTAGATSVTDVRALGIGWDKGVWLGWRAGSWIEADPSRCQIVIIIRSAAEAANAVSVLRAIEGTKPCVVDYTRAPSR